MYSLTERLARARQLKREEYLREEEGKRGVLRAGSSGIMSETGDVAALCHRKAHLRSLGVEHDPPDAGKLVMFELGYANEDVTAELLGLSLEPGETLLREGEIPISWQTRNGVRVSGRPDIVICASTKDYTDPQAILIDQSRAEYTKPILGLELKSIHSVWTAKKVLFEETPSLGNLAQAGHYMWKLNIPYNLYYKSYSQLGQGMSWSERLRSMFPSRGEPGSEYMNYNEKGLALEVKQFEIIYELEFDSGRLMYRRQGNPIHRQGATQWTSSLVTQEDLERYYNYVGEMADKQLLGPRPMTLGPTGSKLNYTECKYCPLSSTCDAYEGQGYAAWLLAVQQKLAGSSAIGTNE